jgi:hypothetical protein
MRAMSAAESFEESLSAADSLVGDGGALLWALLESPIAAAPVAFMVVLFIGVALLARAGAPSVAPTSEALGPGAAAHVTSSSSKTENLPLKPSASLPRGLPKDRGPRPGQLRHHTPGSGLSPNLTHDNAVLGLKNLRRPRVLDLRLLGVQSNARLERGPPGEGTFNSVAGPRPPKPYARLGTTEQGLR